MRVRLQNEYGQVKEAKVGFSWTMFFFTSFVPLFRQDWKWAGIMWGTWAIGIFIIPEILFLWGIFAIVMSCIYNKIYIQGLMVQGYEPASEVDENVLRTRGYLA